MADVLKEFCDLISLDITLSRNFVTDAPDCDTRIVSPTAKHSDHISFCPCNSFYIRLFIKESVIAVLAFCNIPFIERLNHHHESELITKLYKFRSRHVVGSADCIAAHILKKEKLVSESSDIDSSSERAKIMVIADSLEFA